MLKITTDYFSNILLEALYGICADDPILLDDRGISEALDDKLAGAFD